MNIRLLKLLLVFSGCGFLFVQFPFQAAASRQIAPVDFVRDIQPILQAHCYRCHSVQRAQAQLRLDNKAAAMKGGLSGAVIVPGTSRDSRLVQRILGFGGEQRMPLNGAPLSTEQIELIKRWIDEGAIWPENDGAMGRRGDGANEPPKHWSFVKPAKAPLPAVKNKAWARTPIDNFILAKLEQNKLQPSPEAARTTLLRRLSLDLIGLPPTLQEIDEFLADKSAEAYSKVVERLLASPHYGERWGRWWLDAARYADTNGFEKDLPRSIWPYRDWVINAFNRNLPFDQFTIEQLAGDLLPNPTLDQRVATGFLRNSMLNQEGGVDPEQFRVEGLIDRVDAIGKTFLGLTVNCAQCHNHKFDPIKQSEYYQFYAFINSDDEPEFEVPDESVLKKRAEIQAAIASLENELIARTPDLTQRMNDWEKQTRYDDAQWVPLMETEIFAAFGVKFDKLEDGSFLAKGDNSTSNNYRITARTGLRNITGFRLEFLTDPNLPRTGPGRSPDGSFFVSEFSVESAASTQPDKISKVTLTNASANYERADFPVKNVIDGNFKTHWSSDAGAGRRNQSRTMVFATQAPISNDGDILLTMQLAQKSDESIKFGNVMPNIGRFRISVTTAASPKADPLPENVRRLLRLPASQRSRDQQQQVFSYYRTTVPTWADTNQKIDALLNDWPYGATTLALMPRSQARETRIFRRGDWKRPGEAVQPDTPSILHSFPKDAPRNRLGLAQWIVDKRNPLTARVIVNRIWQQYFGTGLVTTPEDFGARCEKPSHPELLDWLAIEFIESGWDIKHLHRLIVNSATYRQSSKQTPQFKDADPTNVWLARAPRLRVESEIIRDIALSASGLLSKKIGGPSVYPPIPDGVLSLGYGAQMPWPTAANGDRWRRGMYIFWKRSVPYPSLSTFDAPTADSSCTRRVKSNTPLQALTTLNDTTFVEAAQALALRIVKEGGATDQARMNYGFRLCTGRLPDVIESSKLMTLLRNQQAYFKGNTASAVYVSAMDINRLPEKVDLHQVAPWTMIARVLLNLDETITKE